MEKKIEIDKMITLSTIHVKDSTCEFLQNESFTNDNNLIVYPKANYGWFIYVGPTEDSFDYESRYIPEDLKMLIRLSRLMSVVWLCLDRDGQELDDWEKYDGEEKIKQS